MRHRPRPRSRWFKEYWKMQNYKPKEPVYRREYFAEFAGIMEREMLADIERRKAEDENA